MCYRIRHNLAPQHEERPHEDKAFIKVKGVKEYCCERQSGEIHQTRK